MKKMRFVICVENVKPKDEELLVERITLLTEELRQEIDNIVYLDDVVEESKE